MPKTGKEVMMAKKKKQRAKPVDDRPPWELTPEEQARWAEEMRKLYRDDRRAAHREHASLFALQVALSDLPEDKHDAAIDEWEKGKA